jgi:hypothetical protein
MAELSCGLVGQLLHIVRLYKVGIDAFCKLVLYLDKFNPLNAELNPIRHLLALVRAHHILHVSRIRVNFACFKCVLFFQIMLN